MSCFVSGIVSLGECTLFATCLERAEVFEAIKSHTKPVISASSPIMQSRLEEKCGVRVLRYDPNARIALTSYADVRGPARMNQSLSERGASRVKACLVKEGVPEERIDIVALGESQNLTRAEVMRLHDQNPNKAGFGKRNSQALVWAYNRRVDVTLLPTGQKSSQFFPGNADDAKLLFRSEWQGRRSIEKAGEGTVSEPKVGQLSDIPAADAGRASSHRP
jgi:OmpA family protein